MLGDFVTRLLLLFLGYAYPAFECFKAVEKNPGEIEQLRFWCQYWIIVAMVTVLERFSDIFASWFPMYGEIKMAFFIFLWYPKTKGTGFVYETFVRPYVAKHEPEIEQRLQYLRAKSGDLLLFYIKNFTSKGQSLFLEVLHYVISRSKSDTAAASTEEIKRPVPSAPPLPERMRRSVNSDPAEDEEAFYYTVDDLLAFTADKLQDTAGTGLDDYDTRVARVRHRRAHHHY